MSLKIFEPIKIGTLELKNRIMRSATWDSTADINGAVTVQSEAIYKKLGEGHIGLIVTGYAFVSQAGQANAGQYGIYSDEMIPGWKKIVKSVHDNGGKIAMQIVHSGINSGYLPSIGKIPLAVSSLHGYARKHQEMTEEDIEGIVTDFGAAALRVREAGFDAVQLHGAHGYLVSQFVSPLYNKRTDQWGGSAENRRRFPIEVTRQLRKVLGNDYPVLIKFGVQDDRDGGTSLSEGVETCRLLEEAGIDSIEVSAGIGASSTVTRENEVVKPVFRERAASVKRAIKIPVAVVNNIRSVDTAQDIIASGDADIVSLCRPFIREPHLVLRWEEGNLAPAKCISCNKCFPILQKERNLACGEERRLREEQT